MSEYDITAKITYDTNGAVASIDKVTAATKASGEAADKSKTNIGQYGSAIGLAGQAVSKLNPALGSMVSVTGQATGAMQAMTTLGLGPVGIALGIVSVAVTAGTALWNLYTESNKEAEAAAKSLSTSLEENEYSLSAIMAKQAKHRADIQARIHVASAAATTDELLAERERLNNELALMRGTALEGSAQMTDVLRQRLDLEERLTVEAVQARADAVYDIESKAARNVADAWIATAVRQAEDKRAGTGAYARRRGTGGGGGRSQSDIDAEGRAQDSADRLARLTEDMDREAQMRADARAEAQSAAEAEVAFQRSLYDQQISDAEDFQAKQRAIADQAMEEKRADAQELADIQSGVANGFQVLNDAIMLSAGSSEKAQKQAQAVMAGVAVVEAGIQAALEVARAAASYPDVVGMAAHATAAAAFVVAGVKAATMGGGSAPSGGGAAPAARTGGPQMSGGSGERGGNVININWGSSGLIYAADRAQLARDLRDVLGNTRLDRGA